jgi:hypothetical protein
MDIKELLYPRFRIIERWPDMGDRGYYCGQIITLDKQDGDQWCIVTARATYYDAYFGGFPHLFERLQWYQERGEDDFPKYAKTYGGNSVREIENIDVMFDRITFKGGKIRKLRHWLPATNEEYAQFMLNRTPNDAVSDTSSNADSNTKQIEP